MKPLWKFLLSTAACAAVFGGAQADLTEEDIVAVEEWVDRKTEITIADKGGNMSLAGDIRLEWHRVSELINDEKQVGSGSGNVPRGPHPNNIFDIQVNLMLKYDCDCTYASMQWRYDNRAGTIAGIPSRTTGPYGGLVESGFGSFGAIRLFEAWMGYTMTDDGCTRFDMAAGRTPLYRIFDSRIQTKNVFDGILATYSTTFDGCGDIDLRGGVFLINQNVDHFGWAAQLSVSNIMDCGVYAKYYFIDWTKKGVSGWSYANDPRFQFRVSQFMLGYEFDPEILCQHANIYAAYGFNSAAEGRDITGGDKENTFWYAGVRVGELVCESDWFAEFRYEYVEAQAVPNFDVLGIGRGNVAGGSLYGNPAGGVVNGSNNGNTNYQGWVIETGYQITNNLVVTLEYNSSQDVKHPPGGKVQYRELDVELIYAF